MTSDVRSVWFDLGALALIWVGGAVITFGAIPQLIDHGFTIGASPIAETPISHSFSPDDLVARRHYFAWAGVGFLVITIGTLLQAWRPFRVIFPRRSA